jgi:Tfp pilus assembly protein PilO
MSAPAPTQAAAAPGGRSIEAGRAALRALAARFTRASAWGGRVPLIAALAVVLLAGIAVLVAYHGFYDARFRALETTRAELLAKRDEGLAAAERIKATEARLKRVQGDLETFNKDVLGTRKERLAALIEDVYALTQKAGLVPGQIGYALDESAGVGRLALTFAVQGRYADVKKLLFSFENNPRFLLVESVAVATDDREPDVLKLNVVVAHYFRPETPGVRRVPRPGAARASSAARPAPTPAPGTGVPE